MANLFTRTYTFVDGTTAYGSQVEAEIGNIVTVLNNLNTAATTWGQVSSAHVTNVPLIADCSAGSQHIADFKNNSVIKASVSSAGLVTCVGLTTTNGITNSGAAIAAGSQKITGLANGTTSGDALAYGQLSPGMIKQRVETNAFTGNTITSASYTDITGASVTITPSASTSVIRVIVIMQCGAAFTNNNEITVIRGSTDIGGTNGVVTFTQNAAANGNYLIAFSIIDSPATTSSTTYKLQAKSDGTHSLFAGNFISVAINRISVEEIGV